MKYSHWKLVTQEIQKSKWMILWAISRYRTAFWNGCTYKSSNGMLKIIKVVKLIPPLNNIDKSEKHSIKGGGIWIFFETTSYAKYSC